MNILVTGAAGFIGHHIVNALKKENANIIGLDIADMSDLEIKRIEGDITDDVAMEGVRHYLENLEAIKIDTIIHLAAIASPPLAQKEPARAWLTNVQGTHNVLQLAQKIGCPRIIFFSSAHVYGISPKYLPTDENHPLALHDLYTTTKIMGEELCRLFYENHGISYTALRLWNAYGPGQSKDYFIGAKLTQAKNGKLTIRNEGVTKDWIHVKDVARATMMALKSHYVGPLNVGTGIETSLGEIVKTFSESFDILATKEEVGDEGPTRMKCDPKRIKSTLGWQHEISFRDGLEELIKLSQASPR